MGIPTVKTPAVALQCKVLMKDFTTLLRANESNGNLIVGKWLDDFSLLLGPSSPSKMAFTQTNEDVSSSTLSPSPLSCILLPNTQMSLLGWRPIQHAALKVCSTPLNRHFLKLINKKEEISYILIIVLKLDVH